jgi:hypothetical protein
LWVKRMTMVNYWCGQCALDESGYLTQ